MSSRATKKLSEKWSKKRKIIQEQANLIHEKEKDSRAEGRNAKDKDKERDHAEMTQRRTFPVHDIGGRRTISRNTQTPLEIVSRDLQS